MSFHASATPIGNSKGLRLDAALYREHPEFSKGDFTVNIIAPGQMLVSAEGNLDDAPVDPVLHAFLGFLEVSMSEHPELISHMRMSDFAEARDLIKGVEVGDDEIFDESFTLP